MKTPIDNGRRIPGPAWANGLVGIIRNGAQASIACRPGAGVPPKVGDTIELDGARWIVTETDRNRDLKLANYTLRLA